MMIKQFSNNGYLYCKNISNERNALEKRQNLT